MHDPHDSKNDSMGELPIKERLSALRRSLSRDLIPAQHLSPPLGLASGYAPLDDYLLWKGFPRENLSLIEANEGLGATSLWIQTATPLTHQKRWVSWLQIQGDLCPVALVQQKLKLSHLLVVKSPPDSKKVFFSLQELISSEVFDLIGTDLSQTPLSFSQWIKLHRLARKHATTLLIIDRPSSRAKPHSLFAVVLQLTEEHLIIQRALHRPTPHTLRRSSHAFFVPALSERDQKQLG